MTALAQYVSTITARKVVAQPNEETKIISVQLLSARAKQPVFESTVVALVAAGNVIETHEHSEVDRTSDRDEEARE